MASRDYRAIYEARRNGPLYQQAESFLLVKAIPDVFNEDAGTQDHAARVAWAEATEASEAELAVQTNRLVLKLCQNSTIAATVAANGVAEDSDVEFVGLSSIAFLVSSFGG